MNAAHLRRCARRLVETWTRRVMPVIMSSGAGCPLIEFAEDHLSRSGLENRGYRDIYILADHFPRIIHHYHGSIIEVSDALVVLFALFEDKDLHDLAGQDDRLQ